MFLALTVAADAEVEVVTEQDEHCFDEDDFAALFLESSGQHVHDDRLHDIVEKCLPKHQVLEEEPERYAEHVPQNYSVRELVEKPDWDDQDLQADAPHLVRGQAAQHLRDSIEKVFCCLEHHGQVKEPNVCLCVCKFVCVCATVCQCLCACECVRVCASASVLASVRAREDGERSGP